jgi:hypothetical protein
MKYGICDMEYSSHNMLYAGVYPRELLPWLVTGNLDTTLNGVNYNIFPNTPNYAKQTQFQKWQNEHKHYCNNDLRNFKPLGWAKKQTQFKANLCQNKPNLLFVLLKW